MESPLATHSKTSGGPAATSCAVLRPPPPTVPSGSPAKMPALAPALMPAPVQQGPPPSARRPLKELGLQRRLARLWRSRVRVRARRAHAATVIQRFYRTSRSAAAAGKAAFPARTRSRRRSLLDRFSHLDQIAARDGPLVPFSSGPTDAVSALALAPVLSMAMPSGPVDANQTLESLAQQTWAQMEAWGGNGATETGTKIRGVAVGGRTARQHSRLVPLTRPGSTTPATTAAAPHAANAEAGSVVAPGQPAGAASERPLRSGSVPSSSSAAYLSRPEGRCAHRVSSSAPRARPSVDHKRQQLQALMLARRPSSSPMRLSRASAAARPSPYEPHTSPAGRRSTQPEDNGAALALRSQLDDLRRRAGSIREALAESQRVVALMDARSVEREQGSTAAAVGQVDQSPWPEASRSSGRGVFTFPASLSSSSRASVPAFYESELRRSERNRKWKAGRDAVFSTDQMR